MVYQQSGGSNRAISPFEKEAKKIMSKIDERINKYKDNQDNNGFEIQLCEIKKEVLKMLKYLSKDKFLPSYPHFIIDSWDYTDSLGNELMDLYEKYVKL